MARKVTKILGLLQYLSIPRSIKGIKEYIGISERGVYRYLKDLREAGCEIFSQNGKYCLYEKQPEIIFVVYKDKSVESIEMTDQKGLLIFWRKE